MASLQTVEGSELHDEITSQPAPTADETEEITEVFNLLDSDKNGLLDFQELWRASSTLHLNITQVELQSHLQKHDFSSLSVFTLLQFQSVVAPMVVRRDPKMLLLKAFESFDRKNNGYIDLEDLKVAKMELGLMYDEQELKDMIEAFDSDGYGVLDFNAFCGIFKRPLIDNGNNIG